MDFLKCVVEWCGDMNQRAETSGALKECVDELLSTLNVRNFGFVSDRHDGVDILTNFPTAWTKNYQANALFESDPVVVSCKKNPRPITWTDTMTSKQSEKFFDHARDYGLPQNGISTYHFDRFYGGAVFSIAADFDTVEDLGSATEVLCGVDLLSRHFVLKVGELNRCEVALTGRELDVLTWASLGKSAWETGRILGISEGTTNGYIHSATRKLEANSKPQAVANALRLGLI